MAVQDVLIVNAGSSAGTEDITEAVIREFGELIFHGVASCPASHHVRPHRRQTRLRHSGLSVSAVISFKIFLQAVYEKLCSFIQVRMVLGASPLQAASTIGSRRCCGSGSW